MSRYLAYLCPRTDKFFKEKDVYVAHLRVLAKASLREKRIAREMRVVRESFSRLRLSATSDASILDWLVENSAEIIRVANLLRPTTPSSLAKMQVQSTGIVAENARYQISQIAIGRQVDTAIVLPFEPRGSNASLVGGRVSFAASAGGRNTFLDAAREVLNRLPGLSVGGSDRKLSLWAYLYAEDWPFIAAAALFNFRQFVGQDNELDYSLARVMERQYPMLTFEGYVSVCKSSLLDDELLGELAFNNWLRHGSDAALTLPALADGTVVGSPVFD